MQCKGGPPPNILECRKDYIKPLFFYELYETPDCGQPRPDSD